MTDYESPRLAIVGNRSVVEIALLPALRRLNWKPSVLIDLSSQQIDLAAHKLGSKIPRVIRSSDWRSVAKDFNAAIVALPPVLHGRTATELLIAGKHVFLEKPLPLTNEECLTINRAAAGSSVTLSVGLQRRYLQVVRWTEALIQSGTLGDIKRVDAREGMVSRLDTISGALLEPDPATDSRLRSAGADTLDLVLRLFGNIELVCYRDDSEGGIESERLLECRLPSGASVKIELSRTRRLSNSIRVEGEQGFVEVHLFKNEVLAGSPNVMAFSHNGISAHTMKPQFVADLFEAELSDFRRSILKGDQASVPGCEYIKVVELIERCYASRQPLLYPWTKPAPVTPLSARVARSSLLDKSKVLVTGATGFIGGRLVERLIQEHDAQVRCIIRDVRRTARLGRLPVEMVRADLSNAAELERAVDGVNYIFHCAYLQSRRQNIHALHNIVQACRAHPVQRLIHVSTFAVYEPFPDGSLTEETPDGNRSNDYVDTKLELEGIIFEAVRKFGIAATIVQPSIVYGPFCWPWTNIPAEKLLAGEVVLPDRGEGLCNAVYIDDLVDGLILSAVSPNAIGERFIVSGPESVTWATFFKEFARFLGTNPPAFWPYDRIAKANMEIARVVRIAALNPRRVIDFIMKWNAARQVLEASLDRMPARLRRLAVNNFDPNAHRTNERYVPNPRELAFYSAKAITNSEKARINLGYIPRFDFERGMSLTGPYLEWAYGNAREIGRRRRVRW